MQDKNAQSLRGSPEHGSAEVTNPYEKGDKIQLEAVGLEFVVGGNTIWVHGLCGTLLRIKCLGEIRVDVCSAPGGHADVIVAGDIKFCVPPVDQEGAAYQVEGP